ncbi:copper homeostasis protein CutC [Bacillus sp. FSL K6-3431]|uniref:copper homeostasis protein CutC n=1 Tax=Bacillus sp. FSL K6-3431 TaxID=2921500 RepID=UPI0030FCD03D
MIIEVIIQNELEAIQAEEYGADRLELVSAISEGGLTPSYGTLKRVLRSTQLPVQIMIRPHSYGFLYNDADWEVMKEDISLIRELGGTGIVFGALNSDNTVDEQLLENVINHAPDLDITFHRAFDEVASLETAYKTLTNYKQHVRRILTSGGKASCVDATKELKWLVDQSRLTEGPAILPGSGLSHENLATIHQVVGAGEYHFGSGVRLDKAFNNELSKISMNQIRNTLG